MLVNWEQLQCMVTTPFGMQRISFSIEYSNNQVSWDLKRVKRDVRPSSALSLQQVLLHTSQKNASSAVINLPLLCEGDTGHCFLLSRYLVSLTLTLTTLDAGISFIVVSCLRFCCQIGMCDTKRQMTFFWDFVHRMIYNVSRRFGSRLCSHLRARKAPNLLDTLDQRFPTCAPRSPKGLRVHFPGAPRPLQENKINKTWMKLKNKKQKVESK